MFSIHAPFLTFHSFKKKCFHDYCFQYNYNPRTNLFCLFVTLTERANFFLRGRLARKNKVGASDTLLFCQRFTVVSYALPFQYGGQNTTNRCSKIGRFCKEIRKELFLQMANFKPRGSIIQFNWQETAEGREFLGGILHRNRRKTFGEWFDTVLDGYSHPPRSQEIARELNDVLNA